MTEHVNLNVSIYAYSPQNCIKCIFGIFDVRVNVYDLNIHVVGKIIYAVCYRLYVCIIYICKYVVHKGQNGLLLINKLILSRA